MTNAFLKPAQLAGDEVALVRDPETMIPLAAAGEWKTISPFWTRRIRDKEVIDATLSSAAIVAATPARASAKPRAPIDEAVKAE